MAHITQKFKVTIELEIVVEGERRIPESEIVEGIIKGVKFDDPMVNDAVTSIGLSEVHEVAAAEIRGGSISPPFGSSEAVGLDGVPLYVGDTVQEIDAHGQLDEQKGKITSVIGELVKIRWEGSHTSTPLIKPDHLIRTEVG